MRDEAYAGGELAAVCRCDARFQCAPGDCLCVCSDPANTAQGTEAALRPVAAHVCCTVCPCDLLRVKLVVAAMDTGRFDQTTKRWTARPPSGKAVTGPDVVHPVSGCSLPALFRPVSETEYAPPASD